jgi:hypothetical protein
MISLCHTFLSHFFLLPSTFIYESILIKIYMNANGSYPQIFHLNKYELNGHKSSIIKFLSNFFWLHYFLLPNTFIYISILIKNYANSIYYDRQIFHLNKYVLKGHWRSQKLNNQALSKFICNTFSSF